MIKSVHLQKLLAKINIEEAFEVTFGIQNNVNTYCPFHENEQTSQSPSCSVCQDGLFSCKGCGAKGDVFDFYARAHNTTRVQAIETLQKKSASPSTSKKSSSKLIRKKRTLEPYMVEQCEKQLKEHSYYLTYLQEVRGLTLETITKFHIGCDEHRITIPVFDENNTIVNFRRYLPNAHNAPKMVSFSVGYGKTRLFPYPEFLAASDSQPVILCEGEWDCLLL